MTAPPARRFVATDHVEGRPRAWLYASRVAQPLAVAWSALAVLALTSALLGSDPLGWLLWAAPATYLAVTAWAMFDLRRQPAEFVVTEGMIRARSLWDAAEPGAPFQTGPAIPGRMTGTSLYVPVGETVYRLDPERWADLAELHDHLRSAYHAPRPDAAVA